MKFYSFITLLTLASIFACSTDAPADAFPELVEIEKTLSEDPTDENLEQYVRFIDSLILREPENKERNAALLQRAAALEFNLNRIPSSAAMLNRAIKSYYMTSHTRKNVATLANIYENNLSKTSLASYLKKISADLFSESNMPRVDADGTPFLSNIEAAKNALYDQKSNKMNFGAAKDFIDYSEAYAMLYPSDERSAGLIYEAGKVAGYINDHDKAVSLFKWSYNAYPDAEYAPQSLFMIGYTYDNSLNQDELASSYYSMFSDKYAEHELNESVRFLQSNLGKTDEEIFNQIIQK